MKFRQALRQAWRDSANGDPWGRVQEWRFAAADCMVAKFGMHVVGFKPAPSGPEKNEVYNFINLNFTRRTLARLWSILNRLAAIHRAAGREY